MMEKPNFSEIQLSGADGKRRLALERYGELMQDDATFRASSQPRKAEIISDSCDSAVEFETALLAVFIREGAKDTSRAA